MSTITCKCFSAYISNYHFYKAVSQVFLRLRNSKTADKTDEVYTLDDEEPATLVASAPETSETHKNSQRIHTLSVQKFKFSKIFLPSTEQAELFESTALPLLGGLMGAGVDLQLNDKYKLEMQLNEEKL